MAEGILSVGDGGRDAGTYDIATDSPMTLEGEGSVGDAMVITSGTNVRPQTPGGGGSVGDVSRQGVTVDNRIARWHGSGAEVQSSVVTINDDGDISGYGTLTGGSSNIQLTDGLGNLILASMEQDGAAALEALVWSGTKWEPGGVMPAGGAIGGTGTINQIPKFSASQALADSDMSDDGATTTLVTNDFIVALGDVGIGTTEPESALDVRGPAGSGAASAGVITASSDELTLVDGDYIGRYDFNASIPAATGSTPNTSYDTQSVTAGANLTDFTLLVNLANMTAAWWLDVDTSDGTRGRVFKEDLTELAVDWISFDNGAETGWIRVKWSGTLSGAGANTIRIYPPNAANASVAVGDTYGRYNAYDANWKMYLTLDEAVNNDVDGYKDRTVNANHGTGKSMALTEVAGQVGNAQDFDGSADHIEGKNAFAFGSDDFSIWLWIRTTTAAQKDIFGITDDGNLRTVRLRANTDELLASSSGETTFELRDFDRNRHLVSVAFDIYDGVLHHIIVTRDGTASKIYVDGISRALTTGLSDLEVGSNFDLGRIFAYAGHNFRGSFIDEIEAQLDEIQVHSSQPTADEVAEEFAQAKNNLTYWGTWSNVPSGGGAPPTRKVTASIHAEAADTFANATTKTDIVFSTGTITSATEKMRLGAIGTLGLGVVPLANMAAGMMVLEGGAIVLKEITTPTADADYAKIYPKADNILYFQDGAGIEHTLPTGTGTADTMSKWRSGGALEDSDMTDDGATTTVVTNDFIVALGDFQVTAGDSGFGRGPVANVRVIIGEANSQTGDMLRLINAGAGDVAIGFATSIASGNPGTDWIMGTRGADGSFGLGLGLSGVSNFPAFVVDNLKNFELPVGVLDVTLGDVNVPSGDVSLGGFLVLPKASTNGIKVDRTTPTFGWADIIGDQFSNNTGATKPILTTYNGAVKSWKFGVGDEAYMSFHMPHDYVKGTDIFLHIHWSHIAGLVTGGTVTFKITSIYAKGHDQTAFTSSPAVGTFVGTVSTTTQYQHILTEVQYSDSTPTGLQVDTDLLEPDGVIEMTFELDANDITVSGGNVPDPFIHLVDIHYQSTGLIGTKDKAPDFYV